MRRTSPATITRAMLKRKRRGQGQQAFTLIELVLVVLVLSAMVAIVVPRLIAIKKSRDLTNLEASIARLPTLARNAAMSSGKPVTLQISDDTLVMQQSQTDGSAAQQLKQVPLGNQITVENTQLDSKTVDPTAWTWTAYPDGSADSGGLEFTEGTVQKSLVIPRDRNVRWIDGALPDTSGDEWTAGQLLPRS